MRITKAAATLIAQVQHHHHQATVTPIGPADGLGVIRTIRFDTTTGTWLEPLLAEIADPRIAGVTTDDKGRLLVTFVRTTKADHRDDFPLDAAILVLAASRPAPPPPAIDESPPEDDPTFDFSEGQHSREQR